MQKRRGRAETPPRLFCQIEHLFHVKHIAFSCRRVRQFFPGEAGLGRISRKFASSVFVQTIPPGCLLGVAPKPFKHPTIGWMSCAPLRGAYTSEHPAHVPEISRYYTSQ